MEQVSVDPRIYPRCIWMEKALLIILLADHSFRGKCEKSDFNSSRISPWFDISSPPNLVSDPIRFFFDTRNEW